MTDRCRGTLRGFRPTKKRENLKLERWLADYARVGCANRAKFAKLTIVLRQLHESGIDCLLLKGADVVARLYGVLGLRPMADIDLLVRERDLPAIDRLLRALGYRPQIDGNPAYVDSEDSLALDLITGVWYLDDQEIIWQRAVERDFGGIPVKGMGRGDLLVYLTAYNVIHRGCLSAAFAYDIALLVEKEDVDWNFVIDEAARRHLKIPMYHGLSFVATRYTGAPIPDQVLTRLAPSTLRERLWHRFLEKLVTEQPVAELGHLLLFIAQPGSKKWRWLRDAFSPSPAFLKYRYGAHGAARPVRTRFKRSVYLVLRAQLLMARVVTLLVKRT